MITYIPFDERKFDFDGIVSRFFDMQDLNYLDQLYGVFVDKLFEVGKDSSTMFHDLFYDRYRKGWPSLESTYAEFIKEVVSPLFNEDFLFQKFPTFRIMLRDNVAVGAFHTDSEFGHPDGEINFIIPLTNSDDTASVWVESEEGKQDYKPIKLRVGWLAKFNGNKLSHGNFKNETGKNRVSLDFRILPLSMYKPEEAKESITQKTKFIEGQYYKRFIQQV